MSYKVEAFDYGEYSACWSCSRKGGEPVRALFTLSWQRRGRQRSVTQSRAACLTHAKVFADRHGLAMPEEHKPLSDKRLHALEVLRDHGPQISGMLADYLWPGRHFKNGQGAGRAAGGWMGKLEKEGLVRTLYRKPDVRGQVWPAGWVLTVDGRVALRLELERRAGG